jgi:hypothetical protein
VSDVVKPTKAEGIAVVIKLKRLAEQGKTFAEFSTRQGAAA